LTSSEAWLPYLVELLYYPHCGRIHLGNALPLNCVSVVAARPACRSAYVGTDQKRARGDNGEVRGCLAGFLRQRRGGFRRCAFGDDRRPRTHRTECKVSCNDHRGERPSEQSMGRIAEQHLIGSDTDPSCAKPAGQITAEGRR
jgi:hypothetical protein